MADQTIRLRLDGTADARDVGALMAWLAREEPLEERVRAGGLRISEARSSEPESGAPMGVGSEIVVALVSSAATPVFHQLVQEIRRAVVAWRDNRREVEHGDPPQVDVDVVSSDGDGWPGVRLRPAGEGQPGAAGGCLGYDTTVPPFGVPGDLPAVKHNLNLLRDVLPRGRVFGDHEVRVLRSPTLDDFDRALRTAAQEAEGLLLVYFAGHGAITAAGDELFLQMRNASVVAGGQAVFPGAEMVTTMLTMLAAGRAERIVVVLDCCFAGNAGWIWENFRDRRRVLLQLSVQANHRIDAGDGTGPTPFTERLVRLLDRDGEVRFAELSRRLREVMRQDGYRTVRGDPWEPRGRWEPEEDVLLSARPVRGSGLILRCGGRCAGPSDPSAGRPPHGARGWRCSACCGRAAVSSPGGSGAGGAAADRDPDHPGAGPRRPGTRVVRHLHPRRRQPSCGPPLELRVQTDPDLESTVRSAADAYLTSQANTTGDGCRRSGITVYSAGSADVVTALQRQSHAWQEPSGDDIDPQRDIGPQPDIWIPASVADAARVTAHQDIDSVVALTSDAEPLAYSPLVLAVPKSLAGEAVREADCG